MKTAVINIKIEPRVKKQAKKVAADLGFNLSSLLNGYLKHLIKTKAIHFSSKPEGEPTKYMISSLKESERDVKAGRVSPVFDSAEDAITWLHK
jgi:addiction module RelB/DinJ family antitoxin